DNLAQFHQWQNWEWIMCNVPVGVFARPSARLEARGARAAEEYARHKLPSEAAALLPGSRPPVWSFLDVPMVNQSSTAIRARGDW
ncbi:MAG: nicotinic acid mononucleotide adenylyltransferase, partial [Rhodobacteraceae bacterium]|nr:nicotinic acid mononucleotide adenylyltransferase [Paracoccaceae bacterium]